MPPCPDPAFDEAAVLVEEKIGELATGRDRKQKGDKDGAQERE